MTDNRISSAALTIFDYFRFVYFSICAHPEIFSHLFIKCQWMMPKNSNKRYTDMK